MKTIEKYSEIIVNWTAKLMFAAANNVGKCAYFKDENAHWDYYTDNFCAYGVPEVLNMCKTESKHIVQLSDRFLKNLPERELFLTSRVEMYKKPYEKKAVPVSILKDSEGNETFINQKYLKPLEKYPYPFKFVQHSTLSAVYAIDVNTDIVIALIMPINPTFRNKEV